MCAKLPTFTPKRSSYMRQLTIFYTLADDKRKTLWCTISKAGSSSLKYYLMKLNDSSIPNNYWPHSRKNLKKHGFRFLVNYTREEIQFRLENYYKYIIIRDPFDRMVSTHRDKFLHKDEVFYRNHLRNKIKDQYRLPGVAQSKDVEFEEFVKFVANGKNLIDFDRHWIPQFFVCDPCNIHYDYVAKFETYESDLGNIFPELGWNCHIKTLTAPRKAEVSPVISQP